ncbi:MAG TPA: hypothetical protein VFH11_03085 [Gemmatimonadota bacterium]|nr:hypothetical protein [Gemmatimonadota bacterium]
MSRRIPVPLLLLAFFLGCSDSPVTIPASDRAGVRLIREATRNLPERPQGIAVTPDGRFIVVSSYAGWKIEVLDAGTLQTITSTEMRNPWGVTIDLSGGIAWVAGKRGTSALALPGLEEIAQIPLYARSLVRGSQSNTLYAIDPVVGEIVSLDAVTRKTIARLAHSSVYSDSACLALADGQVLLAGNGDGPLLVLDPVDLRLIREIPVECWAVVPLDEDGKALVLSGVQDSESQYPTASVVDWRTGDSRQLTVPRPSPSALPFTEYGYGNPWVRVDDLIFAPGRQGILVADARNGEVLEFIEGTPSTENTEYCCEIAWDPVRRRLLIVGDYHAGQATVGKLVSYRIER